MFEPIHIKSSPKVKSGPGGVGSNIAETHYFGFLEIISGH